jgi:tetratricopeptide (TPR) repeat protein
MRRFIKLFFIPMAVLGGMSCFAAPSSAASATPWDSYRLYLRGLLDERAGRTAQAMEAYQEALRGDPNAEFLKESLAGLTEGQLDTGTMIRSYEQYLEDVPDHLETLTHLGQLYYLSNRIEEAKDVLDRALVLSPHSPALHYWRGLVAQEEGKGDDAVYHLKLASTNNPDPGLLLRLATYYSRSGEPKETIRILKRLHRLQPENPDFMYFLALAYEDMGKSRSAIRWLNRALKKSPDQPDLLFHLALNWDKLKRFDRTEAYLLHAIEQSPQNALALNYLGYSWADKNVRTAEALELIQRAVALDPKNSAYQDSLGWAYFRVGRSAEAETVLSSIVYVANDPVVWSHYGDVLNAVGRGPEAVRAWQEGLLLSPNDRDLLLRLGEEGRPSQVVPLSAPRTLLKRVEGNYRQVSSLSGLASVRVRAGENSLSGQGLFYYTRPDLFRLEVLGPFMVPQAVLVYNGEAHWTPAISTPGDEGPWMALWGEVLSGNFFKRFDDPSVHVQQEGTTLLYLSKGGKLRLDAQKKSVVEAEIVAGEGDTVILKFSSPREEEGLVLPRVIEGETARGGFRFTLTFSRLSINPSLKPALFIPAP